eukprot:TRINITY_DN6697_c0_g1_i5.p1 TRINITY_DN6697_c0_g1~~TRINITY_DN6697_c0_g1_i5.p1  ORF type:complete len:102 (-),score=7.63 TRINITY_DN6697_c0_g1_i5:45-350(-)
MQEQRIPERDREFVLDALFEGNVARFFNHSCEPNLETQSVIKEVQDGRFPRICFFTSRIVEPGEELTVFYGNGHILDCKCGAPNCATTMIPVDDSDIEDDF